MKKLMIDCQTGKKEYVDMSAEEEQRRLDEINIAEQLEQERLTNERLRNEAIDRLRLSSNSSIQDLLLVLGVD